MKKTLCALALSSAFAGAAFAQTNVTIYGIADVGLARATASNAASVWRMDSGNQSGSRLGFRGTEDLGDGLSAIFTLENGYNIDTGTLGQGGRLFGRQGFVGLSSKQFGTFKFGRQYIPMHIAQAIVDPFEVNLAGNMQNVFSANGMNAAGSTLGTADVRMDNTINYTTPALGAFSAEVAYGLGEVAGNAAAGRQVGFSAKYSAGPLNAVLVYHGSNNATATADGKSTMLGGTYDFQVVKVHAAYGVNKQTTSSGATTADSRDLLVGVTVPVGAAGAVLASYIRHDDRLSVGAVDADQSAIGYTHALSKRTNLYTVYGRLNRKPAGAVDTSLFQAGIRHMF